MCVCVCIKLALQEGCVHFQNLKGQRWDLAKEDTLYLSLSYHTKWKRAADFVSHERCQRGERYTNKIVCMVFSGHVHSRDEVKS